MRKRLQRKSICTDAMHRKLSRAVGAYVETGGYRVIAAAIDAGFATNRAAIELSILTEVQEAAAPGQMSKWLMG